MKLADLRGHWALVTGASSGIGREFAVQLAGLGMHVVLVARRQDRLEALEAQLREQHGVRALVMAMDLTQAGMVAQLQRELAGKDIRIRLLCNNAAFGRWGRFEETPPALYREMIELNTTVVMEMCHVFLHDLSSYPSSLVINVSSPASYQPIPYMAVYAASKAFLQSFSLALHGEWKARGVMVQTLVPGPTESEFDSTARAYESALTKRGAPAEVVRASLAQLDSGNPVASAAKGIFKQRFFAGLFPPSMVIREVGKMFTPPK
ncbi:MAG: SDR family NAD(P)-dependent oxidoreductase [Telluria sp.]